MLPCSYPPACRAVLPSPYHRLFHRQPRPSADARIPKSTMNSLSANPEGPTSRSLWTQTVKPPLSASFTYFEALFLSQVRSQSTRVAPRQWPMLSWVSSSTESSPTTPRCLHPSKPQGLEHHPDPKAKAATDRTSQARRPRRPHQPGRTPRGTYQHPKEFCRLALPRCETARTTSRWPHLLPRPPSYEQARRHGPRSI